MAQTCIVCLGDLRSLEDIETPEAANPAPSTEGRSLRNTRLTSKKYVNDAPACALPRPMLPREKWDEVSEPRLRLTRDSVLNDDEIIAHLLPCGHNLHNSCLKPWVERANSCPTCRTTFNMVELNLAIGGEVIDSYGVQDKVQQAEIDPTLVVEDEPGLEEECELCDAEAPIYEMVQCQSCHYTVHAVCAGFDSADDTPDQWTCTDCTIRLGRAGRSNAQTTPGRLQRSAGQVWRRSAARANRRSRSDQEDGMWSRVWMSVSQRLGFDWDFPYDHDEDIDGHRTPAQRREFSNWQRRFELADRQGGSRRFQELATRLQPQIAQPEPEPQDVLRAWNAFEKARESQEAPLSVRRKRRRSHEPTPDPDAEAAETRELKRPRLRRPPSGDRVPPTESAGHAQESAEPTFLSSLLKEVEQRRASTAASPEAGGEHHSPRNSSPARSSECATPPLPTTPPPQYNRSPPLSSTIAPPLSPPGLTFSPFSPINGRDLEHKRGRQRDGSLPKPDRNGSSSPGAQLSYSSKEEVQRMVKLAIGSRYRDGDITKDQYTDINRDVSRKLYDMIGNAAQLGSEDARAKWQAVAEKEVGLAISQLQTVLDDSGGSS